MRNEKIISGICNNCKHPTSVHDDKLGCTVSILYRENKETNVFTDKNCPCQLGKNQKKLIQ